MKMKSAILLWSMTALPLCSVVLGASTAEDLSIVADELLRPSSTSDEASAVDFNVYLVNRGPQPVSVAVGSGVSTSTNPDGALFVFAPSRRTDGSLVKPASVEIGVTELKPGEIVFLKRITILSPNASGQLQFMYSVSDSTQDFYDVWIGDCRSTVRLRSRSIQREVEKKAAQPGATDNPGDAQ